MAEGGNFEIHSEAHGPHWIAWVSRGSTETPARPVVLVGQTREEAEARARAWAEANEELRTGT